MSEYQNFIDFMERNVTLLHSDELRPTKSITRNIITGVKPFVEYYKKSKNIRFSSDEISKDILHLNTNLSSTTRDNIRNLEELGFIAKDRNSTNYYVLTRNFSDFVNSGLQVKEYILRQLYSIKSIEDITMFYNYIFCVLLEASKYGYITSYPDSFVKFYNKVPNQDIRVQLCKKIYEIYGFCSRGKEFGEYTPNANYRVLATCDSLGLISKDKFDENGFPKYILTKNGEKLLNRLNTNFSWINDDCSSEEDITVNSTINSDKPYDDEMDQTYINQVNSVPQEMLNDVVDMPLPLANSFGNPIKKRDPVKGANAKKRANYKCEYDNSHQTFSTSYSSGYVEAHHLIPLSMQKSFVCSLDVEANIVALCSNCHNLLHHGEFKDKKIILEKLYKERENRLKSCGIYITLDNLLKIYE